MRCYSAGRARGGAGRMAGRSAPMICAMRGAGAAPPSAPAQRQRAGEDDRALYHGRQLGRQQRVLQPDDEHVVDQVHADRHWPSGCRAPCQRTRANRTATASTAKQLPKHASTKLRSERSCNQRRGAGPGRVSAVVPAHTRTAAAPRPASAPVPRQRAVRRQQAALDAAGADRDAGQEIHRVMQRPAELERKRSALRPVRRPEQQRQRHIGHRRREHQTGRKRAGCCRA